MKRLPPLLLAAALLAALPVRAQPKPDETGPTAAGVVPDTLRRPDDGADDAPSIRRAVAAACGTGAPNLLFRARHYRLLTAVVQSCYVNWLGQGWQEQNPVPAAAPGTFFDVGPAFIGVAAGPVTLTGDAAGSRISRVGFTEPGHPPPPAPVTAGGAVTGWSPAGWTPAAYAPVLTISGAPGVMVEDVMLLGVNAGIVCAGSGRCDIRRVKGQAFAYAVNVQDAYDQSTVVDVHLWPYWSAADPVVQWQQAHAAGIISLRNDTPFWDRIFVFGAKDGVLIGGQADGTTTGLAVGTLSCDFVQSCLRVEAGAAGVTFQVNNLRSYAQAWNGTAGAPVAMLAGSAVLSLAGPTVGQVGQIEGFGSDTAVVRLLEGAAASSLAIGSLVTHAARMNAGAVEFSFPPGGHGVVTLMAHQVAGGSPALSNLAPGKGGAGSLRVPAMVDVQ